MSAIDVIRFWKDEKYRSSLSESVRSQMPPNPAGLIDLKEAELEDEELHLIVGAGLKTTRCQ